MAFLKRKLDANESPPADLLSLGVEQRRVPGEGWAWAVDLERKACFTQLISDTGEMREGYYWYALTFDQFTTILHVDAFSDIRIDGRRHLKAQFQYVPKNLSADDLSNLQMLAHEAMVAISDRSEGLFFDLPVNAPIHPPAPVSPEGIELQQQNDLIIKASIVKMVWLLIIMGAFTFFFVFSIRFMPVWGWISTIFFAPLFVLSFYVYRPSATYLRLNTEGMDIVNMGRRFKLRWSDVEGFHVGNIKGDTQIGILYTDAYLEQQTAHFIHDPDHAWIRDLYSLPIDSLCKILNQWKSAYDQRKT